MPSLVFLVRSCHNCHPVAALRTNLRRLVYFFAFYTIIYLCGGRPVARICTCRRRLVVFVEIGFLAVYRNYHPVAVLRTNLRRLGVLFF